MAGFTLVEVLVTITLSLLVTGLGTVMYRDYYNQKIVKVVADTWAREVELLIKKNDSGSVLSSDIGSGCQGVFLATVISSVGGSGQYDVYTKCSQANSPGVSYSLETNDPNKVVVFGSSQVLEVMPLSRGVKESKTFDLCLQTSAGSKCYYQVVVEKTGVVYVAKI
ncbi:MAG: hypothetical protein GXP43_00970 [bacterium]|nr:hypothetical protein [bacterium]